MTGRRYWHILSHKHLSMIALVLENTLRTKVELRLQRLWSQTGYLLAKVFIEITMYIICLVT